MTQPDPKADLVRYLQTARDAMVWKLDGLSEYDVRRPMTPTGTNLLGMVKHLASVEAGYFGETSAGPSPNRCRGSTTTPSPTPTCGPPPTSPANTSSGSTAGCGRMQTRRSTQLSLDALGQVPWWPAERSEVTLHRILIHMIAETNRHAGHADIVRELIDGAAGSARQRQHAARRAVVVAGLPREARAHGSRGQATATG